LEPDRARFLALNRELTDLHHHIVAAQEVFDSVFYEIKDDRKEVERLSGSIAEAENNLDEWLMRHNAEYQTLLRLIRIDGGSEP
jgi:predicted  nucleic acid-binding Zn-ribbon protein